MKRLAVVGLAVLSACGAPEDALVSRCSTGVMSTVTECQLSAARLTQPRSSYLDGNTKNEKVHVTATFSVRKGQVSVAIPGCGERGRAQVVADRPASMNCEAALDRSSFWFEVEARPGDGGAEGFAGKLSFRPI